MIAATHQNLERLISEGKFREDLYYRLNVISILLPPLRERPDDILDLAVSFLKAASARAGKRFAQFDDDALNALMRYPWPGNIRELQNVIERAVVMAESETIELVDLPADIQNLSTMQRFSGGSNSSHESSNGEPGSSQTWQHDESSTERQHLIQVLQQCGGNKTKAAKRLGIPRSTYFSKLKKYGITDDEMNEAPRYGRLPR